jgi:HK97 family phage portal protein
MSSEDRALSDIIWTPDGGDAISSRAMSYEPEIRSISWNNLLLSDELFTGKWTTSSEVRINPDTCIQSTVLLACARILSETIASLPIIVYRRTKDGHREYAKECPLNKVLGFSPNEWQTKFEWLEQLVFTTCIWGNNYTLVRSGQYGAVSLLHHLHPSRMKVERLENGRLKYTYADPEKGRMIPYTQDQIMHVRWTPEPDGVKGMMPIEIARDAIALARATEIFASKFWANMGRPGFVLQTDQNLSPEAAERLRDNWERAHRGVHNAWKTAVLTNGLKAEPIGTSNSDSQFLEVRRFQCEEICRVFRLPLAMVQGQSSGGDLETQGQEFVTYTLMPWLKRIELAISRSLIYDDDTYFAEFDTSGLLRGNSQARASYLSSMLNLGLMTINEARRYENLASIGPDGDHHMVAMNMQPLEDAVKPKPEPPPAAPPGGEGGPPPKEPDGPPSLSEVKTGVAPMKAVEGKPSQPKLTNESRAFCPTGDGGGVDNTCGGKEEGTIDAGKILRKIAENPGGFTLDRHSAEQPTDGIMVSEFPNDSKRALILDADKIETAETRNGLISWLKNNRDVMDGRKDRFIGGWSSDNKFYLDVATRFPPDKGKEALEAGRAAGQLAVFNLGNFKETWVKYAEGDSRKPKDWDKAFKKAKSKDQAAVDELDQHGHHSVRSIVVDRLVSRGYTYTEASRLVEAAELQRIVEEIERGTSGHSRQGVSNRSLPGVPRLGRGEGCVEWKEARPVLVSGRSRRHSRTVRTDSRAYCATGEGNGVNNSCSSRDPGDAAPVAEEPDRGLKRGVDVMIGGGPRVVDIDAAAARRATADYKSHPLPEGFAHGSTTDLWTRTDIIRRDNPKAKSKITSHGEMFDDSDMLHNNVGVSITAVGKYLSSRHQEERRDIGGGDTGPTHIIDTTKPLTDQQRRYVSDALSQDVLHAYDRGLSPGFYSEDLKKTMETMSLLHPELETDSDARNIFTVLTAITSNGQNPDVNLQGAHDLYAMYKEHGTVVPSQKLFGERSKEIGESLSMFQSMLDSFGKERTCRLLSGYAPVSRVNDVFRKLSAKSQNAEWREKNASKPWILGDHKTGDRAIAHGSELDHVVVPVAAIFGPKIGAFYANLSGRHDFVTMDRWLMRSVGRVTGELVTRTSPESAANQAESCLEALAANPSRKAMFGSGLTRSQVVRSLKIQKKTGVIEENGAAYAWAYAASKSYEKTPSGKIGKDGKPLGFGKTGDPRVDEAHTVGNTLRKSLVDEQQDPRSAVARVNIRDIISDVVRKVEEKYPDRAGKVDRDEVQAILWQYEKNLFKTMGAITRITDNSLFSAAADGVLENHKSGKSRTVTPASKSRKSQRSQTEFSEPSKDIDDVDSQQFGEEQWSWASDLAQSGIDPVELFEEIEKLLGDGDNGGDDDNGPDDSEPPAPEMSLGSKRQSRAYCPNGAGGGVTNDCGSSGDAKAALKESLKSLPHEITADHEALVRKKDFSPADGGSNSDFVKIPDDEALANAMGKNAVSPADREHFGLPIKKGESYIGFHRNLPDGTPVAFRIDIPTFKRTLAKGSPIYAVTVHEDDGKGKESVGRRLGHDGIARMSGKVTFKTDEHSPLMIAGGAEDKSPIATVKGGFDRSREVPKDIDEWTPVGFDPEKAAYFYNKKTGQEVVSGEDAVSVGNTVFTRNPEHCTRNVKTRYRSEETSDAEERAFCPTGDGGGVDNTCSGGFETSVEDNDSLDESDSYSDTSSRMASEYAYRIGAADSVASWNSLKEAQAGDAGSVAAELDAWTNGSWKSGASPSLSAAVSSASLPTGTPPLFRGLSIKSDKLKEILSIGSISHSGVQSWSLDAGVAAQFGSGFNPKNNNNVILVIDSPKRGLINPSGESEKEVLVPSSSLKISKKVSAGSKDGSRKVLFVHVLQSDESSRAFCPNGEGNGVTNDCGAKGDSKLASTGTGKSDWSGEKLKSDEPFKGASKFEQVTVSAGEKVAKALDAMKVDHGDAFEMASGGIEGGKVYVRPAPEHDKTAVFFDVTRDFMGVKEGITSSSILYDVGATGSPELVLKQNVIDVALPVAEDKQKRQAAGREFMRVMTNSVEKAKSMGVTKVVLSAAGTAKDKGPVAWRGYTIWPRMGFDAPLPFHVRQNLPETLSHCKTLLDLHATPEGTRWWRDVGGTDIDVQLDLKDKSSPQARVFDRFVKHFSKDSRAMALGGGMDWLSPEDVTKIESMWEEIWDSDMLDDYSPDDQDFKLIEEKHADS